VSVPRSKAPWFNLFGHVLLSITTYSYWILTTRYTVILPVPKGQEGEQLRGGQYTSTNNRCSNSTTTTHRYLRIGGFSIVRSGYSARLYITLSLSQPAIGFREMEYLFSIFVYCSKGFQKDNVYLRFTLLEVQVQVPAYLKDCVVRSSSFDHSFWDHRFLLGPYIQDLSW
jgi:hypothetical protein